MNINMDDVFGLSPSRIGTCENCGNTNVKVRSVRSYAGDFGSGSRGFFQICYGCFGPHKKIHVGRGRHQQTIYTDKEEHEEE